MPVIRIAVFKFDVLKPFIYMISMSRSIRTDSDDFPYKKTLSV